MKRLKECEKVNYIVKSGEQMKIIAGPASMKLGEKIAEFLSAEIVPAFFKTFPDGESYIRFDVTSLRNEDVVIVQTTSPPQDQRLIQLLLMADTALSMKANTITAIVPYFAYNRQDKRFLAGEAFSIKTIMKMLEHCGVNRIITVNAHNPNVLKTFNISVKDLSGITLLAEYFKAKGLAKNPVSLSLGKKALKIATEADRILKGGFDYISTKRNIRTGKVTLEDKELQIKGRDVIIFDDIISSGGTMARAVKLTKEQSARKVYAACVHPLLMGDAQERILQNGAEEIIGTDSVPSSVSKVSIAPLIAGVLAQ